MGNITIIGSVNSDMVIRCTHLPRPGETILGKGFMINPGGKGANQAVAAARFGSRVVFIGKTGKDMFGQEARQVLEQEKIDIRFLFPDETTPSGVALIQVDEKGENTIQVAPGANMNLLPGDIDMAEEALFSADILLMQLEIPLQTITYIVKKAKKKGKRVVLNPAPVPPDGVDDKILEGLYAITPNRTEAGLLSGIEITDETTAQQAALALAGKGIRIVVITLGSEGVLVCENGVCQHIPSLQVNAVDTTAAGDTFSGVFVSALAEGMPVAEAASLANRAAAISVTRYGAQAAIPYRKEIEKKI